MPGKVLVLALAVAAGFASDALAQRTLDRMVVIQDTILNDGNYANNQPTPIARGQVVSAYNRSGNLVYIMLDSMPNGRQRNWGWVDAATLLPLDKAVPHFSGCLKKNPTDTGALLGRASAENALGHSDRAIADCDELLRLDPKSVAGFFLRGSIWQTKGKTDKAITDFSEVLRFDPQRTDAYRLRAELYVKQKNYAQAITDFTKLLSLSPNQTDAYYYRSIARYEIGEYRKALDDINEILALQPDSASAYRARGMIWERLRDYDQAEADIVEGLRLHRAQAARWPRTGLYFIMRGDPSSAWSYYSSFWSECNLCADDFTDLADCRAARGQIEKAMADCEEALRINPGSARAHRQRGYYYVDKKQFTQALADFDAALRLDPKAVALHRVARGSCRAMMGQYDAAAADFEEALRLEPASESACNSLAWFLATCQDSRHRDGKRAVVLATKACETDKWESSACIDTLAAAYAEAGNFSEAVRWQQKAVDMATPASKPKMVDRLALYKASKPYREPATPETATAAVGAKTAK